MAKPRSKRKIYVAVAAAVLAALIVVGVVAYLYFNSYTYTSQFDQSQMGALDEEYWVASPELIQGSISFENGMLKIVSGNRFQVGFGTTWHSPTYLTNDYEPWLPVYWKFHCEAVFVKPQGTTEFPFLIIDNWIAFGQGQSYTAMVWYNHGLLEYSYGAFPQWSGYVVPLGNFTLPDTFTVLLDADYKAGTLHVEWAGHVYDVPMQVETVGWVPKPFTHFGITLEEPGTVYVKTLKVVESDQLG